LTALGVWLFRRATRDYSRLLDIPNERSSHTAPVTRGAGIAIVAVVLSLYLYLFGTGSNFAYILAAIAIAAVSFLDDLFSLPVALRLAVHFGAATAFVICSSDLNFTTLSGSAPALGYIVFIVWVVNAYNFMDGIDGIAGIQGVAASIGWILLGVTTGFDSAALLNSILLGSCLGFLVFNWQPAKVFMGDVGSTFLGFTFAAIPILDANYLATVGASSFLVAALMLWLFMFDTIYTRLTQIVTLKPFWKAHRDHLYQVIVRAGSSHSKVSALFGLYGLVLAGAFGLQSSIGLLPSIVLLFIGPACLILWAGKKEIDVSFD
jgi:Fuc2NAc and GlcNAc transferase